MKTYSTISLAQLDAFDDIIDVRSPAEFAIDRLPGAINLPVLDDEERARVGTLYKQVSPFEARRLGAALVARNIARHLETTLAARERSWRPMLYCWRGGMRSGAMAHVLSEVGWRVAVFEGGYQAYRRAILDVLEHLPDSLRFQVVCGPTGSGKSALLRALRDEGAQVLDLEALAEHRGSVLGGMPGKDQPSQKMFETRIWNSLRRFDPTRPVWVEAESRKIGVLQVPEKLLKRVRASVCLRLESPLHARIQHLIGEYPHMLESPVWLKSRLSHLSRLQSGETLARWMRYIDQQDWADLVRDLLVNHYDPLYARSMSVSYPTLDVSTVLKLENLDYSDLRTMARALVAPDSMSDQTCPKARMCATTLRPKAESA